MPLRYKLVLGVLVLVGVLLAVGAAGLMFAGLPTYDVPAVQLPVDDSPQTVARGRSLVSTLCRPCHFDPATEAFSGRVLAEIPEEMGHVVAPNITRDPSDGIGEWSAGEIAFLLRTGIHPKRERMVPPFMPRWPRLADDDAIAIASYLSSDDAWIAARAGGPGHSRYSPLVTWRAYTRWEPFAYPIDPVPRPRADDPIAYGEYLVDALYRCHACHDADPERADPRHPSRSAGYLGGGVAMHDAAGEGVVASNLTPHATGLAGYSTEDLRRVLVDGFRPDGAIVRWPMPRYPSLGALEIEAIFAYLRTVAPIDRAIDRAPRRVIGKVADPGRHVYEREGCPTCHGHDGNGIGDLRDAFEHLDDAAVIAFIADPSAHDPDHVMPSFAGAIASDEHADLIAYLHRLAASHSSASAAP